MKITDMKREIKFRGKRVDNGEWIYGYYYQGREQSYILTTKAPHEKESSGLQPFKPYPVIPESVGQFTGLLDKNGKEIFESDVLNKKKIFEDNMADKRFQPATQINVGFENGCFIDKNTGMPLYDKMRTISSFNVKVWTNYELIGNELENPDLL